MFRIWKPITVHHSKLVTSQLRTSSAWINHARKDVDSSLSKAVDVEKLFIDEKVQLLLKDLTGMDLEGKVFRARKTSIQQRSHFALMTDERLNKTIDRMKEEAAHFLQIVPLKEPRAESVTVLSEDKDIQGFDNSKFVFTDITFDATDQDRTVVVREVDGTLRTATPEEHDRMNRTYYQKPNRPVFPPPVFSDPHLQNALDKNEHEFVLDWACWFYEPDDPAFVKLSQKIFDRVISDQKFDVLHSTRHFGQFVFYLALNGNIPPLLNHFGGQGRLRDCANLIRLQKTLHPDWRVSIASADSDETIVNDFVKQNNRFRDELVDLIAFLRDGSLVSNKKFIDSRSKKVLNNLASKATINSSNIRSSSGPLGELSEEYSVKVAMSNDEKPSEEKQQWKEKEQRKSDRSNTDKPYRRRDYKKKTDE